MLNFHLPVFISNNFKKSKINNENLLFKIVNFGLHFHQPISRDPTNLSTIVAFLMKTARKGNYDQKIVTLNGILFELLLSMHTSNFWLHLIGFITCVVLTKIYYIWNCYGKEMYIQLCTYYGYKTSLHVCFCSKMSAKGQKKKKLL